ncbi:MAG: hypothetical protein NWQ78_02820, partial [Pontimonas sp.]|nr:hypothetical protein [Pontimonas sp.]
LQCSRSNGDSAGVLGRSTVRGVGSPMPVQIHPAVLPVGIAQCGSDCPMRAARSVREGKYGLGQ